MKLKTPARLALGLVAATCATAAHAAFVAPVSWDRADPGTTYQEWDVFSTFTDATPDVADANVNGTASLTENTGTGFITSGGNLYSPSVPTDFTVTIPEADVPQPPHNVTAVVQIRTLGNELDYDSVLLNGLAAADTAELDQQPLGGFGGALVDAWFLFTIPYAAFGDGTPGVEDLTLTFTAADNSVSLDRLSIDTAIRPFGFFAEPNPVPEPASLALIAVGFTLLHNRRRTRQ